MLHLCIAPVVAPVFGAAASDEDTRSKHRQDDEEVVSQYAGEQPQADEDVTSQRKPPPARHVPVVEACSTVRNVAVRKDAAGADRGSGGRPKPQLTDSKRIHVVDGIVVYAPRHHGRISKQIELTCAER